jgi:predicted phage terminase large subunit-like protein
MLTDNEINAAKELLARRQARTNLLDYVKYTWPKGLNPWQTNWHHKDICSAFERVESGECKRLMIYAPPRHGKSEIASIRFPSWYLGKNPHHQIISVSYNEILAKKFGRRVRDLVGSTRFSYLFPSVALAPDSKAKNMWNTTHEGVYFATSLSGGSTGWGMDLGIIDDPIKSREDAESPSFRAKCKDWYNEVFETRLMPGGRIIVMMTRWDEDDLGGYILDRDGDDWEVIKLPAILNEDTDHEEALFEDRIPLDDLKQRRSRMPTRSWKALYQQEPIADSGDFFKRDWIRKYNELPNGLNLYMCTDFAVTSESDSSDPDYTEMGVWGVDPQENIYIVDWWYGRTGPDVWAQEYARLIKRYQALCVWNEGGVIRRATEPLLNRICNEKKAYARTEWLPSINDKKTRARPIQGMLSMGKVYFPETQWADRLIELIVGFPGKRYDDAVDVMSMIGRVVDQAPGGFFTEQQANRSRGYGRKKMESLNWKVL